MSDEDEPMEMKAEETVEPKEETVEEPLQSQNDDKSKKSKKGKKGSNSPPGSPKNTTSIDEMKKGDPNFDKFIPRVIHLQRDIVQSIQQLTQIVQYCFTMKKEDLSTLMIEDNQIDSVRTDLVDYAFGAGTVSHLTLSCIGKSEKFLKLERYHQILDYLRSNIDQ